MKTSFQQAGREFRLAVGQREPDGWPVLFLPDFHLTLKYDSRLPTACGGFGSTNPRRSQGDEQVSVASWLVARLAYLLEAVPEQRRLWLLDGVGEEVETAFEVYDGDELVAMFRLIADPEQIRLVGRVKRADLEEVVVDRFADRLLSDPHKIRGVGELFGNDVSPAGDGTGQIEPDPSPDIAVVVKKIIDGEAVERLDDGRDRCPVSEPAVAREYAVTSTLPVGELPDVEYLQSFCVHGNRGWIFRVDHGGEAVFAVVRDGGTAAAIEWWG